MRRHILWPELKEISKEVVRSCKDEWGKTDIRDKLEVYVLAVVLIIFFVIAMR
jgi:hypothetical protein